MAASKACAKSHLHHRGRAGDLAHFSPWNWIASASKKVQPTDDDEVVEIKDCSKMGVEDHAAHVNDKHWKTMKENYEQFWQSYSDKDEPLILNSIELASDGGLNAEEVQFLWGEDVAARLTKCWGALWNSICLVGNVAYLVYFDVTVLRKEVPPRALRHEKFLVGKALYNGLLSSAADEMSGEQVIIAVEMGLLIVMLLGCMFYTFRVICSRRACDRWWHVYMLFWNILPTLGTFTGMKLLFYVDPAVLLQEVAMELTMLKARLTHGRYFLACWKIVQFVLIRSICFVVGLDAFLVKFRETSESYIDQRELTFQAFLGSAAFLFQVLAVVNLTSIVRRRLFFFVFGGEDCSMSTRDKAKEWVWNAMLTRKIWETHGVFKFVVIMMSFTDCDIQHLLLHVKVIQ